MTTHHLQLPDGRKLTVTETANPASAEVVYRFTGPRAAGALQLAPELTSLQHDVRALPDGVRAQLGTGDGWFDDRARTECPVINGIELTGGVILDPHRHVFTPGYLRFDRRHRPRGRLYYDTSAPEVTNTYMRAIFTAILTLWVARTDLGDLARTAARRTAAARLAQLRHGPIASRLAEVLAASVELDRLLALAAELEALTQPATDPHQQELITL